MSTLSSAINASASALDAQRARMEVAISNLANAESTNFRRRDIVLASDPKQAEPGSFEAIGVRVAGVVEDQDPLRTRYEPSHPDADENGFVHLPNVDVPEEMVDMLGAARAYQANLTAINVIRDTIQRALELGK